MIGYSSRAPKSSYDLADHGCAIRDTIASRPFYNLSCYALRNYIIAMVTRPLRFVLRLSTCGTTDISHLASFAHPRKLIHENFCLKQMFDKPRNIISSKISRPTVLPTAVNNHAGKHLLGTQVKPWLQQANPNVAYR